MNMHYIYILILYVYGLFGPFTASHSSLAISVIASHYALEATPTKMKSTGRSEGCSNNVMTSPVTI